MGIYDEFVDIVDEMFGEWGSSGATYVQPGTPGAYSVTTGVYASGTTDTHVAIKAVFAPVDQKMVNGQTVLASDVMISISPKGLSVLPGIGQTILRGTEKYRILNPRHVKPADTVIVLGYHARAD